MNAQKKCKKCKRLLDSNNFYQSAITKDGLHDICKDCCKVKDRKSIYQPKKKYTGHYYHYFNGN